MNIVVMAVIIVIVTLLMKSLAASSKKAPDVNAEGRMVLKSSKLFGVIGYIGIVFAARIGVVFTAGPGKSFGSYRIGLARFSKANPELTLFNESTRVKVSMYMPGFDSFVSLMQHRIGENLWHDAVQGMALVQNRL